jgi:hypothetical protein
LAAGDVFRHRRDQWVRTPAGFSSGGYADQCLSGCAAIACRGSESRCLTRTVAVGIGLGGCSTSGCSFGFGVRFEVGLRRQYRW